MTDTVKIDNFIARQLQSGHFESREALVEEALRQMMDREEEIKALAEYMRPGAEAWKRGEEGVPFDHQAIKQEVLEELSSK